MIYVVDHEGSVVGRAMKARVAKWGNSLAIRLPKAALASLQVREGEPVDLVIEGDTLLIRAKRPQYSLEQLVAAMRPEDQPEIVDDVMSPRWETRCCE